MQKIKWWWSAACTNGGKRSWSAYHCRDFVKFYSWEDVDNGLEKDTEDQSPEND